MTVMSQWLALCCVLGGNAAMVMSSAASAQAPVSFNIPSQPLSAALEAFGQQAGVEIMFDRAQIRGKTAAPVQGSYAPSDALSRLIAGAGVSVVQPNATTYVVAARSDAAPLSVSAVESSQASVADGAPPSATDSNVTNTSAAQLAEVTVTGSRVITNGTDSPTPVTVVNAAQIMELQPTTIADALNDVPEFSGSLSQTYSAGNGSQNQAANQLNLRNLGAVRTLILYDGFRVQPTSPTGLVDVDMIPQLLLQRVDVVTGGASAVYGSDAVSGVVNFITDTKFEGLKVNAQGGISTYGDDASNDFAAAFGHSLDDGRLHVEASYEYHDDPGIPTKLGRPWGQAVWAVEGAGTAANPYHLVSNARLSSTSFDGLITSGPLSGMQFGQNGVLSAFVNGAATGTNGVQSGGDGGYYSETSLKAAYISHQGFARADYDFTDNLHGFVQLAGTLNHNYENGLVNQVSNVTIGANNAFLPPQYQSELTAAGASSFKFSQMMLQVPGQQEDTHERQYMAIGGLNGDLDRYHWTVGFEDSNSTQNTLDRGDMNEGHLLASLDAVVSPTTGQIVCHAALVNAAYANCVPLNLFGPTAASSAAINYINAATQFWAYTHLDDGNASISGAPFGTWAGPVNMALSGEARKLSYHLDSNAQPTSLANCTGIEYNCTQGTTTAWNSNTLANRSPVSQSVNEFAYETDVPLVKDIPLIRGLNLNGAVRYTDYSNSGSVETWKIGVDWHMTDDFTLRATRSRDIRAPNLNDLYAPTSISPMGFVDVHTGNTSGTTNFVNTSNPNLKPEKADTSTAGVVWQPKLIPGFSASLDAFHIVVDDAITQVTGTSAQVQAICQASGGTSPYCALTIRPLPYSNTTPANYPTEIINEELNIASIDTYGADFEINDATLLLGHSLTTRALLSYQPHIIYSNGPGLGVVDMGDATMGEGADPPAPSLKFTFMGKYFFSEAFSASVMERWRNSMHWSNVTGQVWSTSGVPSTQYTDLTLSYTLKPSVGSAEIFLNIQNLFNTQPVPTGGIAGPDSAEPGFHGGFLIGDDPVGRYFTFGVHLRY